MYIGKLIFFQANIAMRLYFLVSLFIPFLTYGQVGQKTQYVTTDIDNFWRMFDQLKGAKSKRDTIALIQAHYLDRASNGLKQYYDIAKRSTPDIPGAYLKMINRYSTYLQSIRIATESVQSYIPVFDQTFRQLKLLYPNFRSPNVVFAIGFLNAAGRSMPDTTGKSLYDKTLYIGAEMSCISDNANFNNTPVWLRSVTTTIKKTNDLAAHESIHMQQKRPAEGKYSILYLAWVEGGAVLAVDLITKGKGLLSASGLTEKTYKYGIAHEKELWKEFKQDFASGDISREPKWFYNGEENGRPKDLGYFLGYRMCLAYYNQAADKKQAFITMINETDYTSFLKHSRYEESLKNK